MRSLHISQFKFMRERVEAFVTRPQPRAVGEGGGCVSRAPRMCYCKT